MRFQERESQSSVFRRLAPEPYSIPSSSSAAAAAAKMRMTWLCGVLGVLFTLIYFEIGHSLSPLMGAIMIMDDDDDTSDHYSSSYNWFLSFLNLLLKTNAVFFLLVRVCLSRTFSTTLKVAHIYCCLFMSRKVCSRIRYSYVHTPIHIINIQQCY